MKKHLTAFLVVALLLYATLAVAETAPSFEAMGDLEWMFCSGAGGWATYLHIEPDGSFVGDYHDSEMGDIGDGYPLGSVYGCLFHGRLTLGEQVDEYTWRVHVDEVELDEGQAPEAIEDEIRYVTTDPYGIKAGNDMLLFLPGTPVDALPEGFLFWAHILGDDVPDALSCYGLYDEAEDTGFVSYPLDAETE